MAKYNGCLLGLYSIPNNVMYHEIMKHRMLDDVMLSFVIARIIPAVDVVSIIIVDR